MKTESQTNKPQSAREALKILTKSVRPLIEAGQFATVNEALIAAYKSPEHQIFKTYQAWRAEGMTVRKGEKSFLVWSKPKIQKSKDEDNGREEQYTYYPVSYLFSDSQVVELEVKKEVEPRNDQEKTEEFRKIRNRKEKTPEMER